MSTSNLRPNKPTGRAKHGKPTARSSSGLTGAYECQPRGKWRSHIRVNGKTVTLRNKDGKTYFHSMQEAHDAYIVAAVENGIDLSS